MRLLTWNVNGIITLLQYAPWYSLKTYEAMLDELDADIVCFQEIKITRDKVSRNLACMEKWDGFFSCYRRTPPRGIHGTAIFTRRETATPLKAEEGLSHLLVPSEVPAGARIGGYPTTSQAGDDVSLVDMRDLDSEGRTTIADFGLFVVINLYCPNQTNDDRLEFKLRFNALIEARVRNLIKQGKQVIVVGDINICASPLDTCDAEGRARENGISDFMDHPARKWFSHLIGPDGILVDVTRRYHPDRERMFTCWNTKLDARVTNYGTRLDYILVTPGMLPWVKFSDILPDIYGSDHAPVFVDLHDEIEIEGRGTVGLRDELLAGRAPPPEGEYLEAPKFAARNWDEYSGKQRLLSSFFSAKPQPARAGSSGSLAASKPTPSPSPRMRSESSTPAPGSLASSSKANRAPPDVIDISSDSSESSPPPPSKPQKRQKSSSTSGQGLLTAFVRENSSSGDSKQGSSKRSNKKRESSEDKAESSKRAKLDEEEARQSGQPSDPAAAATWASIFSQKPAPLCSGHNEPCKMLVTNKPGINKGRRFWMCARPIGEGYAAERGQVPTNPEMRCDFFQWETIIRRPPGIKLDKRK